MSTIENNKLLADFLVENEGGLTRLREGVYSTLDEFDMPDDDLILSDLKFDTDWNWLMGVVEKIFNLALELDNMEMYDKITDSIPRIDLVHEACVDFVKWYNNQEQ